MANPQRGQVSLVAGDTTYMLSFSVNALCELEEAMDMPVAKIADSLNDAGNVRMSTIRVVVWAALRDHHDAVTVKDAGRIVTEAGIPVAMEAVGKAFALAFPEAQEPKNPRRAAKAD
jgi:hypothetical protein